MSRYVDVSVPRGSEGQCIFCRLVVKPDAPVEHIWPESLGGPDWAVVPKGTVCGKCNNYFSREVEKPALESFPFKLIRGMLGIPTKKGRSSPIITEMGSIVGNGNGTYTFRPSSPEMDRKLASGELKTFRIEHSLEPENTVAVARLLLKMSLEWMVSKNHKRPFLATYDNARTFARFPKRKSIWKFGIVTDMSVFGKTIQKGLDRETVRGNGMAVFGKPGSDFFVTGFIGIGLVIPLAADYAWKPSREKDKVRIYEAMI
jgi:HNH endonuclease